MDEVVRRVAPIVATGVVGLGFLAAGAKIEAKKPVPLVVEAGRFRIIDAQNQEAFDAVTGKTCIITRLPDGFMAKGPLPDCAELSAPNESLAVHPKSSIHLPPGYTLDTPPTKQ